MQIVFFMLKGSLQTPSSLLENLKTFKTRASVAELADALDLGSSGATRGGSTPSTRTILLF